MLTPVTERERQAWADFARHTLGCGCAPEVFQHITTCSNPQEAFDLEGSLLVSIGGRLLILILEPLDERSIDLHLEQLVRSGSQLRDRLEHNRLRIIVLSSDQERSTLELASRFRACSALDDRIHLHILPRQQIPGSNIPLERS